MERVVATMSIVVQLVLAQGTVNETRMLFLAVVCSASLLKPGQKGVHAPTTRTERSVNASSNLADWM